jgi:hypothetical protein
MEFTYSAYEKLLTLLKNCYEICNYKNYKDSPRCVILRHDVDLSLEAALRFAEIEHKHNVRSTYFILLSTGFYNPFHRKAYEIIKKIRVMGHEIGLHFDETRYSIANEKEFARYVEKEASILSAGLNMNIEVVSMHRPSKWVLEKNLKFDNLINSYSKEFISNFKYLSDSRMNWSEDVYRVIQSNMYDRLHILTHPIWYGEQQFNIKDILLGFINNQRYIYYENMRNNIRNLDELLKIDDIII